LKNAKKLIVNRPNKVFKNAGLCHWTIIFFSSNSRIQTYQTAEPETLNRERRQVDTDHRNKSSTPTHTEAAASPPYIVPRARACSCSVLYILWGGGEGGLAPKLKKHVFKQNLTLQTEKGNASELQKLQYSQF